MFNRRTFRVHQIEVDKEESECQGFGASIRPTQIGDVKNEKLFHQDNCAFIFYVYPRKIPWAVLWGFRLIHRVHLSAEAVLADRRIGSFGTSLETIKGEAPSIQEEGSTKADDVGIHSY